MKDLSVAAFEPDFRNVCNIALVSRNISAH
nr:MAG TPA: hypothetical protein [Caudoviricetes sp.]